MIYNQRYVIAAMVAVAALAIACGSAAETGPGVAQKSEQAPVAAAVTMAAPVAAATRPGAAKTPGDAPAPTAEAGVQAPVDATVTKTGEPAVDLPPVGTGVGDLAPSYGLLLAGGATVTSADLTGAGKPVFLMFTATW